MSDNTNQNYGVAVGECHECHRIMPKTVMERKYVSVDRGGFTSWSFGSGEDSGDARFGSMIDRQQVWVCHECEPVVVRETPNEYYQRVRSAPQTTVQKWIAGLFVAAATTAATLVLIYWLL